MIACPSSLSPYFRTMVNQPCRCRAEKVYAFTTWLRHLDCQGFDVGFRGTLSAPFTKTDTNCPRWTPQALLSSAPFLPYAECKGPKRRQSRCKKGSLP